MSGSFHPGRKSGSPGFSVRNCRFAKRSATLGIPYYGRTLLRSDTNFGVRSVCLTTPVGSARRGIVHGRIGTREGSL